MGFALPIVALCLFIALMASDAQQQRHHGRGDG
ncbi:hypothetical protein BN439_0786 [Erwinia amylovora Ea644]|nr:hypothetical protein BN439_0786 [Erwinia amylovora Ea644]CCP05903.1 hypothetical protein BN440_0852 [Erwinia amylovora MR1]